MSRKRVKHLLQLLLAVGVIAVAVGGGGTFASFNAETANAGNTFATGTLYLHDSVNGNTACTSESSSTNSNVPVTIGGSNPGDACDVLFNLPTSTNYATPKTVHLTLSNAGSLDASDLKFQLNGTGCAYTDTASNGTLGRTPGSTTLGTITAGLTSGNAVTTLAVSSLASPVYRGSTVSVVQSTHVETFAVSATALAGATSISVTSQNANYSYTTSAVAYAVVYTTNGSGLSADITSGNTVTTLSVSALARKVWVGSTVALWDGTNYQTFDVAATANAGATSISVTSATAAHNFAAATPTNLYTVPSISALPLSVATTAGIQSGAALQLREGGTISSILTSTHYDTFTAGSTAVGVTSIPVSTYVPSYLYSAGDTVYAAFGPNTACSSIPFTITETNSAFDGPDESTHTGNVLGSGTTNTFEGCSWPLAAAASGGCNFTNADNIANIPTRSPSSTFDTLILSSGGGTGSHTGVNAGTGLDANGGARYFIITVFPQFGDPVMGETAVYDLVWHMDQ